MILGEPIKINPNDVAPQPGWSIIYHPPTGYTVVMWPRSHPTESYQDVLMVTLLGPQGIIKTVMSPMSVPIVYWPEKSATYNPKTGHIIKMVKGSGRRFYTVKIVGTDVSFDLWHESAGHDGYSICDITCNDDGKIVVLEGYRLRVFEESELLDESGNWVANVFTYGPLVDVGYSAADAALLTDPGSGKVVLLDALHAGLDPAIHKTGHARVCTVAGNEIAVGERIVYSEPQVGPVSGVALGGGKFAITYARFESIFTVVGTIAGDSVTFEPTRIVSLDLPEGATVSRLRAARDPIKGVVGCLVTLRRTVPDVRVFLYLFAFPEANNGSFFLPDLLIEGENVGLPIEISFDLASGKFVPLYETPYWPDGGLFALFARASNDKGFWTDFCGQQEVIGWQ